MDRKIPQDSRKIESAIYAYETMLRSLRKIKDLLPMLMEHFNNPENHLKEGEDPKQETSLWVPALNLDADDRKYLKKLFKLVESVSESGCQMLDKTGRGENQIVFFYEKGLTSTFSEMPAILESWEKTCIEDITIYNAELQKVKSREKQEKPTLVN